MAAYKNGPHIKMVVKAATFPMAESKDGRSVVVTPSLVPGSLRIGRSGEEILNDLEEDSMLYTSWSP
ncbi:hypothetical protein CNYM01_14337 [Colletotrichum nymphaeae SA-01]|uniref:Uncharacterized protein n=1 Tax=Colletotrichum nymphaeae SA-01 TaxID=1460502 RepID=A0A135RME4_9PEZI|nr:hypothetical protein CNYM01_14337 [Colletotrichum nymphaeae SA-01]